MLKITFTKPMKDFLRQQMVLSDSEIKRILTKEKVALREELHKTHIRIQEIDLELAELRQGKECSYSRLREIQDMDFLLFNDAV